MPSKKIKAKKHITSKSSKKKAVDARNIHTVSQPNEDKEDGMYVCAVNKEPVSLDIDNTKFSEDNDKSYVQIVNKEITNMDDIKQSNIKNARKESESQSFYNTDLNARNIQSNNKNASKESEIQSFYNTDLNERNIQSNIKNAHKEITNIDYIKQSNFKNAHKQTTNMHEIKQYNFKNAHKQTTSTHDTLGTITAPIPESIPDSQIHRTTNLRISTLTLHNFKSFKSTHTISNIDKYFTPIVGPNGSGKSNLIDGILFVLGYSARKMRHKVSGDLVYCDGNGREKEAYVEVVFVKDVVYRVRRGNEDKDIENCSDENKEYSLLGLNDTNDKGLNRYPHENKEYSLLGLNDEGYNRYPNENKDINRYPNEDKDFYSMCHIEDKKYNENKDINEDKDFNSMSLSNKDKSHNENKDYNRSLNEDKDIKRLFYKKEVTHVLRRTLRSSKSTYILDGKEVSQSLVQDFLKQERIDIQTSRFLIQQGEIESVSQMKPHYGGMLDYLEDIIDTKHFRVSESNLENEYTSLLDLNESKLTTFKFYEKEYFYVRNKMDKVFEDINTYTKRLELENTCHKLEQRIKKINQDKIKKELKMKKEELNELDLRNKEKKEQIMEKESVNKELKKELTTCEQKVKNYQKEYFEADKRNSLFKLKKKNQEKSLKGFMEIISNKKEMNCVRIKEKGIIENEIKENAVEKELYQKESEEIKEYINRSNENEYFEQESGDNNINNRCNEKKNRVSVSEYQKESGEINNNRCNEKKNKVSVSAYQKESGEINNNRCNEKKNKVRVGEVRLKLQNEIKKIEACLMPLYSKKSQFQHEINSNEQKEGILIEAKTKLKELKYEKENIDEYAKNLDNEINKYKEEKNNLELNLENINKDIIETENEISTRKNKMEYLVNIESSKSKGNKIYQVLHKIKGFKGRLGDLGTVSKLHDVCVSTAGKAHLNSYVVETASDAEKCVELIKNNNIERTSFIVMEKIKEHKVKKSNDDCGVLLVDLVECDDQFRKLFWFALGDTILCKDMDEANKIAFGDAKRKIDNPKNENNEYDRTNFENNKYDSTNCENNNYDSKNNKHDNINNKIVNNKYDSKNFENNKYDSTNNKHENNKYDCKNNKHDNINNKIVNNKTTLEDTRRKVVTLDGKMIDKSGLMSGGGIVNNLINIDKSNKKEIIKDSKDKIEKHKNNIEMLKSALEKMIEKKTNIKSEIRNLENKINQTTNTETKIRIIEKEENHLIQKINTIKKEVNSKNIENIKVKQNEIIKEIEQYMKTIQKTQEKLNNMDSIEVKHKKSRLNTLIDKIMYIENRNTQLRSRLEKLEEEDVSKLENEILRIQNEIKNMVCDPDYENRKKELENERMKYEHVLDKVKEVNKIINKIKNEIGNDFGKEIEIKAKINDGNDELKSIEIEMRDLKNVIEKNCKDICRFGRYIEKYKKEEDIDSNDEENSRDSNDEENSRDFNDEENSRANDGENSRDSNDGENSNDVKENRDSNVKKNRGNKNKENIDFNVKKNRGNKNKENIDSNVKKNRDSNDEENSDDIKENRGNNININRDFNDEGNSNDIKENRGNNININRDSNDEENSNDVNYKEKEDTINIDDSFCENYSIEDISEILSRKQKQLRNTEKTSQNISKEIFKEYSSKKQEYIQNKKIYNSHTRKIKKIKSKIDEIKKKHLEKFISGYSKINKHLKEIYQMITFGGNAELEIIDHMNPFSSGIMLTVMPPKKSWVQTANLSGGEKTLASLALVFAIHTYKPSPFYVLDEIDAALDHRNVAVIAEYFINQNKGNSNQNKGVQFMVISLRGELFERSSKMIGVFRNYGLSRAITIDIEKIMDAEKGKRARKIDARN